MIQLRPYQDKAVNHAVEMISERGNSLIVAGTGAGKTIMMAAAIKKYFAGFIAKYKRRPHVLVLVHRTEIHGQNHSKFSLVCPEIATSEITSERKSLKGYVHFGMVQTVSNLMDDFAKSGSYFDLIVIDEAHHAAASTYEEIISKNLIGNPDAALLGVTATPNRGDELPLVHLFDNYYQITSKYLIDSHYLVRPRFVDLAPVFVAKDGEEKGRLAKYIKDDIEGRALISKLCDEFYERKEPGKSIIFAPNHDFCRLIYEELRNRGKNPAYISSGIDDETRKAEIARFEQSENCDELINVDICTEGYDYPELRNLVDFDTNGTQGQWVQKVGRVLRLAPGKVSCTVIDFGGNVDMYPDGVETDVNLEGSVKKERGERLCGDDFFVKRSREVRDATGVVAGSSDRKYTPYHLPAGFESVNDADYGIVIVACGERNDCILVEDDGKYSLFVSDKESLKRDFWGDFGICMSKAIGIVGDMEIESRPISRMQIKLLAPEYPTTALDWNGANCCICWKAWKNEVSRIKTQD